MTHKELLATSERVTRRKGGMLAASNELAAHTMVVAATEMAPPHSQPNLKPLTVALGLEGRVAVLGNSI